MAISFQSYIYLIIMWTDVSWRYSVIQDIAKQAKLKTLTKATNTQSCLKQFTSCIVTNLTVFKSQGKWFPSWCLYLENFFEMKRSLKSRGSRKTFEMAKNKSYKQVGDSNGWTVLFVVWMYIKTKLYFSLLKMGRQPAQRAASPGNLTVSLPSENVLFY